MINLILKVTNLTYLGLEFSYKIYGFINISQFMYNPELVSTFPSKNTYPKISYKYTPTIGSITFNYSKLLKVTDDNDNYPMYMRR